MFSCWILKSSKVFWNFKSQIGIKNGVSIMLLTNIDQFLGLSNGTKLIIQELENNVIRAIVVK